MRWWNSSVRNHSHPNRLFNLQYDVIFFIFYQIMDKDHIMENFLDGKSLGLDSKLFIRVLRNKPDCFGSERRVLVI